MRKTTLIAAILTAAALGAAVVAHAAGVTVNSTVAAGSAFSVTSQNSPSFPITLTGDDQTGTYTAQLQILDARGSGAGWNLQLSASAFTDGAGHNLGASTITSVTSGCHAATSTCTLPTNAISNTNVAMPSSASKILNATAGSGLGRIDVNVNVSTSVPGNTIAGSYSTTLTATLVSGP